MNASIGAASESLDFPREDYTHRRRRRRRRMHSCVRKIVTESVCSTCNNNYRMLKTSLSEGFGRRTVLQCAAIYCMWFRDVHTLVLHTHTNRHTQTYPEKNQFSIVILQCAFSKSRILHRVLFSMLFTSGSVVIHSTYTLSHRYIYTVFCVCLDSVRPTPLESTDFCTLGLYRCNHM